MKNIKRKYVIIVALTLLVGGIAILLGLLFGNSLIQADAPTLIPTENDTIKAFATFAGAMLVSALVLFALLSGF